MVQHIAALPFAIALLAGMLVFLEIGRRVGVRALTRDVSWSKSKLAQVEGSIFGLYALLLAFTFSGAPTRLDARKQLIGEEANAIGTAYARLDLLHPESQPALRSLFRKYLDSRLTIFRKADNLEAANLELSKSIKLQHEIWSRAVAATALPANDPQAGLLLQAINQMFDVATRRTVGALLHPPVVIFCLLFLLALVCSALAGFSMAENGKRSWMHIAGFAAITAISVFVILEIEYPRNDFLHYLDSVEQMLVDLGNSMEPI